MLGASVHTGMPESDAPLSSAGDDAMTPEELRKARNRAYQKRHRMKFKGGSQPSSQPGQTTPAVTGKPSVKKPSAKPVDEIKLQKWLPALCELAALHQNDARYLAPTKLPDPMSDDSGMTMAEANGKRWDDVLEAYDIALTGPEVSLAMAAIGTFVMVMTVHKMPSVPMNAEPKPAKKPLDS